MTLPIFKSPFSISIDLAFLSTKKRIYATFLVAINSYTNKIALVPLKSKKLHDVKDGLIKILTENFKNDRIRRVISDEESALKSNKNKEYFRKNFNVKLLTSSVYKQWLCERSILTVKMLLQKYAFMERKSLYHYWRKFLQRAQDMFNKQFKNNKSIDSFFNSQIVKFAINAPWYSNFLYNVHDHVKIYTSKIGRNAITFKYTRDLGIKPTIFKVTDRKLLFTSLKKKVIHV